jgi:hypothetical protein
MLNITDRNSKARVTTIGAHCLPSRFAARRASFRCACGGECMLAEEKELAGPERSEDPFWKLLGGRAPIADAPPSEEVVRRCSLYRFAVAALLVAAVFFSAA